MLGRARRRQSDAQTCKAMEEKSVDMLGMAALWLYGFETIWNDTKGIGME